MDLQEMREARKKSCAVFAKFCLESKECGDGVFCFFEGEDRKYYFQRITKYTEYDIKKIFTYDCTGKTNVIAVQKLINNNCGYNNINKMFFIDNDYSQITEQNNDLYITPCYSIENLYITENAFGKFLHVEFGLNCLDDDYKKCLKCYNDRLKEFCDHITILNKWLFCQKQKKQSNVIIEPNALKICKYFNIDITSLTNKQTIDEALLYTFYSNAKQITEEERHKCEKWLKKAPLYSLFRGKYFLEFYKKIIFSLKEHNKNGTFFSKKHISVNINIDSNMLSTFSNYADTPECLIEFLNNHKKSKLITA